ncbi:hypothetical protein MAPG_08830 [Magnaporthiopsis poae ATCC 64411]|uniref:Uncharacterized protein n=1 Tax=Magnaporthiopsis poae (strain ATCC 64411 / 73-15) TaxID=644358 RepID=A0A0C4E8C9_MAGP6|nr:hypothetical protein MAPG_08830 [Magnaporthiopsis poae ATCC 64411]
MLSSRGRFVLYSNVLGQCVRAWLAARRGSTSLIAKRHGMAVYLVTSSAVSPAHSREFGQILGCRATTERVEREGLVPRPVEEDACWPRGRGARRTTRGGTRLIGPNHALLTSQAGWTLKIQPRIKERGGGPTLPSRSPSLVCHPFYAPCSFPCRPTPHGHPALAAQHPLIHTTGHDLHAGNAGVHLSCSRYMATGLGSLPGVSRRFPRGTRSKGEIKPAQPQKALPDGSAW